MLRYIHLKKYFASHSDGSQCQGAKQNKKEYIHFVTQRTKQFWFQWQMSLTFTVYIGRNTFLPKLNNTQNLSAENVVSFGKEKDLVEG